MPTAILKFRLPEEENEFHDAVSGACYKACLWDIQQRLREMWKYEENTSEVAEKVSQIRDIFHSILEENFVNLD